jgi:hypothetical protein
MIDEKLLYKLLRYLLEASFIYLVLRYTPYIQLDQTKALAVTIIVLIICMALEYLYVNMAIVPAQSLEPEPENEKMDQMLEKFQDNNCQGCSIKNAPTSGSNCRVVCDNPDKVEGFDSTNKPNPPATSDEPKSSIHVNSDEPKETGGNKNEPVHPKETKETIETKETTETKEKPEPTREPAAQEQQGCDAKAKRPSNNGDYYWGTRYGQLGYDDRYGFGGMFYDEYPFYNRFKNNDFDNLQNLGDKTGNVKSGEGEDAREIVEEHNVNDRKRAQEAKARSTSGYENPYQDPGSNSQKRKSREYHRRIEGDLDDELPYTDYNHLPVAAGYKSHDYEYGYTFLPPEKWYPQPPRPPICVTDKRAPVCPTYTQGTPVDVKEFHSANRVTPPDLISTDYVREKLVAGR